VVDERALFDALRAGQLAAAGLDVWYRYPEGEETRTTTRPPAGVNLKAFDRRLSMISCCTHSTSTSIVSGAWASMVRVNSMPFRRASLSG